MLIADLSKLLSFDKVKLGRVLQKALQSQQQPCFQQNRMCRMRSPKFFSFSLGRA